MSADPTFSSTLQRGQLSLVTEAGAGGDGGEARGAFSSCSTEMPLRGFLDFAGGVSGAESESGGDPGAEKGESGGEPGPESGGEPGPESGGDPGGESGAFSSSPVTRLVAELKSDDPKLNIVEAAAGGFAVSVNPPKPPNNFPATDSSCFGAACA